MAPARVADMGCGTGSLSVLIAEAGHHVSGIDSAAKMIYEAQAKAAIAGAEVVFDVGDASARRGGPGPSMSTSAGMCCGHFHTKWVLADWVNLLVPGGHLLLIEGHWSTGAGIGAEELLGLLPATLENVEVTWLNDPERGAAG